jgi:hypothetical protein
MKMSALPQGGMPGENLAGTGPNTNRIAAAKAIAAGESPIAVTREQPIEKEKLDVKRIKMRTNVSPDRFDAALQEALSTETGAKADPSVPAQVVEDTKPLSPHVAALAKERRAIQRERMELEAKRKELAAQPSTTGTDELVARLKAKPMSVLQEYGVTYDQLTEAILSNSDGINPEIQKLKEEIKALKEGVDKNFTDRDSASERQVLAEMQREATAMSASGDTFEMVREERAIPTVMKLIYKTYKDTGEVLDVSEAMSLVEDELLKDNLKRVKFKKIQSQLTPAPQPVQQRQNQMRTLTNRDSSSVGLSRRERAILAMKGQLK